MTSAMQNSLFFGPSFLPGQDGDIRIRRETTRCISDFVIECSVVTAVHSFVSFHSVGGDDGEFHSHHGAFVEKERDDGEFEGRSRFLWGLPSVSEIFWAMNPVPFPFCFSVSVSDLSVFLCLSISHTDRYTRTNTHKHPTDQNKHAHTRKNTHPHQRK